MKRYAALFLVLMIILVGCEASTVETGQHRQK